MHYAGGKETVVVVKCHWDSALPVLETAQNFGIKISERQKSPNLTICHIPLPPLLAISCKCCKSSIDLTQLSKIWPGELSKQFSGLGLRLKEQMPRERKEEGARQRGGDDERSSNYTDFRISIKVSPPPSKGRLPNIKISLIKIPDN